MCNNYSLSSVDFYKTVFYTSSLHSNDESDQMFGLGSIRQDYYYKTRIKVEPV